MLASEIIDLAAQTDRPVSCGAYGCSLNYPNRLWEKQPNPSHYAESEHAEPEGIIWAFLPALLYSAKNSHCGHLSIAAFSTGYHK